MSDNIQFKGAHINWECVTSNSPEGLYKGAIHVEELTYDGYQQLIARFPRQLNFIGKPRK